MTTTIVVEPDNAAKQVASETGGRFWHKTDMPVAPIHVRFRGKADIAKQGGNVRS
jgi:hypothetical protein